MQIDFGRLVLEDEQREKTGSFSHQNLRSAFDCGCRVVRLRILEASHSPAHSSWASFRVLFDPIDVR